MNSITQNYRELKALFLTAFDDLIRQGFVPSGDDKTGYTHEDLAEFKKDLSENRFLVSVCGQIKAGKSSFLNFLLFDGKPILPVAATPWTAKLTRISYAEKEYARVQFYSSQEWETLRTAKVVDEELGETPVSYFETFLRPDLEKSAAAGVYDREYIRPVAKTLELSRLEDLDAYVSSKGKFTPFVSTVEIFFNNETLKDVIIVDTPGINDPNELRSKATTEFINQSSAVVYLFHSTTPLARSDLDFIDRHLASIPSSRIVFGMGKCDRVKDIEGIRDYIEEHLRTNPALQERNLLQNSRVYPFSTIAAQIRRRKELGQPLTENEKYYQESTPQWLIEKGGLIGDLFQAIEKNIMRDRASAILESAYNRIRAVGLARTNWLNAAIGDKEQLIVGLDLSATELAAKIEQVKLIRDAIDRSISDLEKQKTRVLKKIREEILRKKDAILPSTRSRYTAWLDARTAREAIKLSGFEIQRILSDEINNQVDYMVAESFFNDLADFQEQIKTRLKEQTKELLPFNRYGFIFAPMIPVRQILNDALASLRDLPNALDQLRVKFLGFTREKATKVNIAAAAFSALEAPVNDFCASLNTGINRELEQFVDQLTEEVRGFLNRYQQQLDTLAEDDTNKTGKLEKARAELETLQQTLNQFNEHFRAIDSTACAPWRIYQSKQTAHE